MQQAYENQTSPDLAADGPEEVALWALRWIGGVRRRCPSSGVGPAVIERELAGIADIFGEIFNQPADGGLRPPQVGMPGCLELTKDERRLLHAIAAMQGADEELLDNYLYKLALDRAMRRRLAEVVRKLAACLGVHGWLPCPPSTMPLPGGAPAGARVQDRDMQDVRVAWP